MKKELVHVDQYRIDLEINKLSALIPQIELLRQQAKAITGTLPETLSGESEVNQYLTLTDFPNATTSMAAELMGLKEPYFSYISNLRGLGNLDAYCIDADGKVALSPSQVALVTEENSLYLAGEKLKVYKRILNACEVVNEVNTILPNPIAHRLIQVDYNGSATPNIGLILHGIR